MSEKIVIQHRIVGIDEFPEGIGFVAVYLEPIEKLSFRKKSGMQTVPKVHVTGMGGREIPLQLQQAMQSMAMEISSDIEERMMPKRKTDPRDFIHVEPMIDFIPRGWKFGDVISVTMEKTKDVTEIDPSEFEVKSQ